MGLFSWRHQLCNVYYENNKGVTWMHKKTISILRIACLSVTVTVSAYGALYVWSRAAFWGMFLYGLVFSTAVGMTLADNPDDPGRKYILYTFFLMLFSVAILWLSPINALDYGVILSDSLTDTLIGLVLYILIVYVGGLTVCAMLQSKEK